MTSRRNLPKPCADLNLHYEYLMKWQAGGVHHNLVHDEDTPVPGQVLLVSWLIPPADATFAERLPQVQVHGLFEALPVAGQAQTYVQGQWIQPVLAS